MAGGIINRKRDQKENETKKKVENDLQKERQK